MSKSRRPVIQRGGAVRSISAGSSPRGPASWSSARTPPSRSLPPASRWPIATAA